MSRNPAQSPEARIKIARAMRSRPPILGRPCSSETRSKIADSLRGRSLSEETKAKISAAAKRLGLRPPPNTKRGSAHPGWQGGTTPHRNKEFRTPEYIAFRQAVLERDHYTCQLCGARNGLGETIRLEVDHILSYAGYPDLRFDPSNGRTLCVQCHRSSRRNRPRPQAVDFVPKPCVCVHCLEEFRIRNPRKYCPSCRLLLCCPICGSTSCRHSARRQLA